MLELLQQISRTALGRTTAIGLNGHQHDRFTGKQTPDPVDHQHRANPMLLLQPLDHGRDPALAKAWVMLQFKSLKWISVHGDGAHTPDERRARSSIPPPASKFIPGVERRRSDLDLNAVHHSPPRERRKKGQFITGVEQLVCVDQLLVHGNADALQRSQLQLLPELTCGGPLRPKRQRALSPAGPVPQGSEQENPQHSDRPS